MSGLRTDDWQNPTSAEYALDEPEFMAEYGRAMAAWGNVEHALSNLFATVLDVREVHHARAAFHGVISFRDRLGLIDAPIEIMTNGWPGVQWAELKKDWRRLQDVTSKSSKKRNLLAHMHVWHSRKFKDTFGFKDVTRLSSLPIDADERKKVVITAITMRDYRKSFESCTRRIRNFDERLAAAMQAPLRDAISAHTKK